MRLSRCIREHQVGSDAISDALRSELMVWMRRSENEDLIVRLKVKIADWLRGHTVIVFPEQRGWNLSTCLTFYFDEAGHPVDPHWQPTTGGFDLSARWRWDLYVSRRGPLLTCETAAMEVMEDRCGVVCADTLPRQPALAWTQQMAADLGLRYVDTATLRAWQVNYEDIDPEFYLDHDRGLLPTAFQVLFYE